MLDLFGFLVSVTNTGTLVRELPRSNRVATLTKSFRLSRLSGSVAPQAGSKKESLSAPAAACKNAVWQLIIMP